MPFGHDVAFRHRIRSMTLMDQCVYVWASVLVPFKDEEVPELSARIFADALDTLGQLSPDCLAPIREAFIGITFVEIDASGAYKSAGKTLIVVGSLWAESLSNEPGPLASFTLLHGPRAPGCRALLAARIALPTAYVRRQKERHRRWVAARQSPNRYITVMDDATGVAVGKDPELP